MVIKPHILATVCSSSGASASVACVSLSSRSASLITNFSAFGVIGALCFGCLRGGGDQLGK
jgi:hypothetical protein